MRTYGSKNEGSSQLQWFIRLMRIRELDPGLSPEEYCASVWRLPGLLAVNTPHPDQDDRQLDIFLLFVNRENALTARTDIEGGRSLPRQQGAAIFLSK